MNGPVGGLVYEKKTSNYSERKHVRNNEKPIISKVRYEHFLFQALSSKNLIG